MTKPKRDWLTPITGTRPRRRQGTPTQLSGYDRAKVLRFIVDDLGTSFTADTANIRAIAAYMDWTPKHVYGVLGLMTHQGDLKWSRRAALWTVVESDQNEAA